jgi:thiamine pyrophosphokinase
MDGMLRHIAACNNARLPGERRPLRIGAAVVGWVRPGLAAALAEFPHVDDTPAGLILAAPAGLPEIARRLAAAGQFRWRGEAFDVRAVPDGPVLAQVDRGALPALGMVSVGVHVNGLVRGGAGVQVWVGYRSRAKHLDPGNLDHLVAGGVPAGMTPRETLAKEAGEEAALPPDLAAAAVQAGRIGYAMEREEGLRRDLLLCYDLDVPPEFTPRPMDDEVEHFELWPIERALATVREGDRFKFNVNLVLIDLFLRLGLVIGGEATRLRAALQNPAPGAPR